MGIQALVLKINGSYNAIVLTDSNNISRDIIKLAMQSNGGRVYYAMGRDYILPSFFSKIHKKYQTPATNTGIAAVLTI